MVRVNTKDAQWCGKREEQLTSLKGQATLLERQSEQTHNKKEKKQPINQAEKGHIRQS